MWILSIVRITTIKCLCAGFFYCVRSCVCLRFLSFISFLLSFCAVQTKQQKWLCWSWPTYYVIVKHIEYRISDITPCHVYIELTECNANATICVCNTLYKYIFNWIHMYFCCVAAHYFIGLMKKSKKKKNYHFFANFWQLLNFRTRMRGFVFVGR